uniref:Retrotransposon gag domain-containing protein n=1 Tax=Tanacetum cinerariifolium TaxID=118510 RepID=A0A6L2KHM6_TANCI|nr:hypothetical protein [Tanacetum cinerariifolium]
MHRAWLDQKLREMSILRLRVNSFENREDNFSENKNDDAHEHIERVLDIVSLFNIPRVTHDAIMLRVFPITLTRAAKRWVDRLTPRTINTWDLLKKAFIQRLIPGMTPAEGLTTIQTMTDHSQKLHDGSPSQGENVHAIQVGCQFCNEPHLDKECPLNKDAKSVKEEKYGEGRSSPFNGTKYHARPPAYYTRVDNHPPFKKGASPKNLETQIEQLTKEVHAKAGTVVPTSSVGQCKAVYDDAPIKNASSNKANEIHRVSLIDEHKDDDLSSEGANINIMTRSMFEHLKLANLKETNILVEMADMTKKWTIEDEDDLNGITDYLEPTSYDGFIDGEDDAYKERLWNLLGMPYRRPPPIVIEKVEVTRYNIDLGETYTKTKNLGINEIPQTSTDVATIHAVLMDELRAGKSTQGAT